MPYMNVPVRYLSSSISHSRNKKRRPFFTSLRRFVLSFIGTLFLLFHDGCYQALGILDIDGLNIAVELLLGVLLVVSSTADADA